MNIILRVHDSLGATPYVHVVIWFCCKRCECKCDCCESWSKCECAGRSRCCWNHPSCNPVLCSGGWRGEHLQNQGSVTYILGLFKLKILPLPFCPLPGWLQAVDTPHWGTNSILIPHPMNPWDSFPRWGCPPYIHVGILEQCIQCLWWLGDQLTLSLAASFLVLVHTDHPLL